MTALEFETAQAPKWSELEKLLAREERALDPERFLDLYRMCCEHLVLAQARGFPANVIERLSVATARAHQIVYRQSEFGLTRVLRILTEGFPRAVRANWKYALAAAALLTLPAITIGVATYFRPDLILSVVDSRVAAEFEQMYGPAAKSIGHVRDSGDDWSMFGFYIMNNIGIAFQCYVTGVLFGLGSVFFLFWNGVSMGAIAGYVTARGFGTTFFSFVVTHSAFEITAIALCGAAGLRLGRSILFPGRMTRLASMQVAARDTSSIVFGSAVMLIIAAAFEAFWSSATWVMPTAKYACASACWALVLLFFLRRPRAD
jgi:uncharacterized membrane protein SpoIIM required for sporulation